MDITLSAFAGLQYQYEMVNYRPPIKNSKRKTYTTPCAIIALATFINPAILAPFT